MFNFSGSTQLLTWYVFKERGNAPALLHDLWEDKQYIVGRDDEYLVLEPYGFCLLEGQ